MTTLAVLENYTRIRGLDFLAGAFILLGLILIVIGYGTLPSCITQTCIDQSRLLGAIGIILWTAGSLSEFILMLYRVFLQRIG